MAPSDMSQVTAVPTAGALELPPAFEAIALSGPAADAFGHARRIAAEAGAGTLVWADGEELLELAVVLEPDEPLRGARRAFLVGMEALAVAVGHAAPPEKPLTFDWPDAIRFDRARIGGGRLAWPSGCGEDERPDWLVFGGTLIASKTWAGDPGLTPDTTSLAEEGFDRADHPRLVEAFARHLLWAFDRWAAYGIDAVAADYLTRLRLDPGARPALSEAGDLVAGAEANRLPLLPALMAPTWLDPATGSPRL